MIEPIELGALISLLEDRARTEPLFFDFCRFAPTNLQSYRGYYEQLAVGFSHEEGNTVRKFLDECRAAVGKVFTGYKGGDYVMRENTPIWVSNYSETSNTVVVGVEDGEGVTILTTGYCS